MLAQIMKARLESASVVALHPGMATQLAEDCLCGPSCHSLSEPGNEERGIQLSRMLLLALV
jgi:hypothetical protein